MYIVIKESEKIQVNAVVINNFDKAVNRAARLTKHNNTNYVVYALQPIVETSTTVEQHYHAQV